MNDVSPPTTSSSSELPFLDLDWETFERMCRDLVREQSYSQVHRYGKPGQRQHGIDFRGIAPNGDRCAFQSRNVADMTAADLQQATSAFANGPQAIQTKRFIICLAVEANETKFQDELKRQRDCREFEIHVWDSPELTHRLRRHKNLIQTYFGRHWVEALLGPVPTNDQDLDSEALLLGPVEVLGLTPLVRRGQQLLDGSPTDAARIFGEVADSLRERFSQHACRFDQFRAAALANAGDWKTSHDLLMELVVHDLFEKAEPQLTPGVAHLIRTANEAVDGVRKTRGAAFLAFVDGHEHPQHLTDFAAHIDSIPPNDAFASYMAALFVESASAQSKEQVVRERETKLRSIANAGTEELGIRIEVALADAIGREEWINLADSATSLKYTGPMGAFVCRRAARWFAWNGDTNKAESLYRLAIRLGADSNLDRDVEDALWSLSSLHAMRLQMDEWGASNRMALAINGSQSYLTVNPRTRTNAYRHFACDEMPDAHLWAKFWLLESIRNGCLMDELGAHNLLARIYNQANEIELALEHAVLGGDERQVEEIAHSAGRWPSFASTTLRIQSSWTQKPGLTVVKILGDIAPQDVARNLANWLVSRIKSEGLRSDYAPSLFDALSAVILEADSEPIQELMPMLFAAAKRQPEVIRRTDSGVAMIAARLYRFRPVFRERAANILGEIAIGLHTIDWIRALNQCGDDKRDLLRAFESIADREKVSLLDTFSKLHHSTPATQSLWMRRLEIVEEHTTGPRTNYQMQAQFDVSVDFLEQQGQSRAVQYVRKLIAIACDEHEPTNNRAHSLRCAAASVHLLPKSERAELFSAIRHLTEFDISISELDHIHADSMHALSRFRFAPGDTSELRGAAGLFLARAATGSAERLAVQDMSRAWIRSDDRTLQHFAALFLVDHLDPIAPHVCAELLAHSNPMVQRVAINDRVVAALQDVSVFKSLAIDGDTGIRVAVGRILTVIKSIDAGEHAEVRAILANDVSALVRAVAS